MREIKKFKRVLVANRGEIAIQIFRACMNWVYVPLRFIQKKIRGLFFVQKQTNLIR